MTTPDPTPPEPPAARQRLRSLDALRGFVIAAMLLVNMTWNRDALPAWLFHVPWNDPSQGVTFADLVFPWFVFVAGCAAPLSMRAGRGRGRSRIEMLGAAAVRAGKLYLLGVLLTVASFADKRLLVWHDLLSWNILQLLGAAYLLIVAAQLLTPRWRAAAIVVVLGAKWLTFSAPYEWVASLATPRAPEGAPDGPGTWAHFDAVKQLLHLEFVANPGVASRLLGWLGMVQQYAPLAAIGAIGAALTERLEAGRTRGSVTCVIATGALLVAGGFALQAGYDPEGGGLWGVATAPFSKWLISPAYCLLAAGTGALLLAAFFVGIDLDAWLDLPWLRALGKNALAVYLGAELSFKLVISKWLLPLPESAGGGGDSIAGATQAWIESATGSPAFAGLAWAALWIALWTAIAIRLDRRGWYWRV